MTHPRRRQSHPIASSGMGLTVEYVRGMCLRPRMFLGVDDFRSLACFVDGFEAARRDFSAAGDEMSFQQWITFRFNFTTTIPAWPGAILRLCSNDSELAIKMFCQLWEEYCGVVRDKGHAELLLEYERVRKPIHDDFNASAAAGVESWFKALDRHRPVIPLFFKCRRCGIVSSLARVRGEWDAGLCSGLGGVRLKTIKAICTKCESKGAELWLIKNMNPVVTITRRRGSDWAECPCCGWFVRFRKRIDWRGGRHVWCGQRLKVEMEQPL